MQRGRAFARSDEAVGAGNDGQFFAAEELANLAAGVIGPGSVVVELDIGAPVAERGALLPAALIGERQVVVGIGVAPARE